MDSEDVAIKIADTFRKSSMRHFNLLSCWTSTILNTSSLLIGSAIFTCIFSRLIKTFVRPECLLSKTSDTSSVLSGKSSPIFSKYSIYY